MNERHGMGFKGAGVLFAVRSAAEGEWELLLGKRENGRRWERRLARWGVPCGGGYWTLPGGGCSGKDRNPLDCGLREALEECWGNSVVINRPVKDCFLRRMSEVLVPDAQIEIVQPPHVARIPFLMVYHSYLVRLSCKPDPKRWPHPNEEYASGSGAGMRWWPLSGLPHDLHLCAARTIRFFRKKGHLG